MNARGEMLAKIGEALWAVTQTEFGEDIPREMEEAALDVVLAAGERRWYCEDIKSGTCWAHPEVIEHGSVKVWAEAHKRRGCGWRLVLPDLTGGEEKP